MKIDQRSIKYRSKKHSQNETPKGHQKNRKNKSASVRSGRILHPTLPRTPSLFLLLSLSTKLLFWLMEALGHASKLFNSFGGWRIFFEGPGGCFFRVFFLHRFFIDFSSILEGFWRPTCAPKSILGEVLGMLFWHPHFVAFF